MLARAGVLDRRRLRAGLEVGLGRTAPSRGAPGRVELLRAGEVRGARDRDLAVVEVGAGAHEREHLERLRRRAEEGEQPRVAGLGNDLPVADGDGVHGVDRLDDTAAGYLDLDRIGHCRETTSMTMPELPEVEAWVRELDPLVSRAPIERAGPAHIATVKTFDPPLATLEGRTFAGARRRGKNLLFPTEDGELVLRVHLMSAGRLRYHARGREDAEDADVPAHVRGRRRARAHRGRQEEARRRLAVHARGARGRARASRPRCSRPRPRAARRDPRPRATPAPSAPARPAGARGHRARARERDPLAGEALALQALDRPLGTTRSRGSRRRSTTTCSRALALREAGKGDADVYRIHGHFGEPCPLGHDTLRRVAFEEHTITYCPTCQTGGKELKDRRLSRLLR